MQSAKPGQVLELFQSTYMNCSKRGRSRSKQVAGSLGNNLKLTENRCLASNFAWTKL